MTYFTILHWFAVILIGLLTILIIVLSVRNHDGKSSLLSPILATLFIMTIFAIFAIYGIDKYTKIARLENVVQKKSSSMNLFLFQDKYAILGILK